MSLINQVLRDLDRRRALPPAAAPALRLAPPARRPPWRLVALGAAIAASAAAAAAVSVWPAAAPELPRPFEERAGVRSLAGHVTASRALTPTLSQGEREPIQEAPALLSLKIDTTRLRANLDAPVARVRAEALPAMATTPAPAEPRIDKRSAQRTPRERADAHYQQGLAAHQAGRASDAAEAFAAALRDDATFSAARQALAGLWAVQGRADDAQALLVEGLALAPSAAGTLMLARLQAERGDLNSAADTLKAALPATDAPQTAAQAELLGLYAAVLQRAGRHADAATQFSAALRLLPANGLWWLGLGVSLAADDRADAARAAFQRARHSGALTPELAAFVEQRLKAM